MQRDMPQIALHQAEKSSRRTPPPSSSFGEGNVTTSVSTEQLLTTPRKPSEPETAASRSPRASRTPGPPKEGNQRQLDMLQAQKLTSEPDICKSGHGLTPSAPCQVQLGGGLDLRLSFSSPFSSSCYSESHSAQTIGWENIYGVRGNVLEIRAFF